MVRGLLYLPRMMKVTSTKASGGSRSLVVEGSVSGPWVPVLRATLESEPPSLELDLSAVSFVDAEGRALLRSALEAGAKIGAASPFVASLLGLQGAGEPGSAS